MARLVPYSEVEKLASFQQADDLGRTVARDVAVTELAKMAGAALLYEELEKDAFGGALIKGLGALGRKAIKAPGTLLKRRGVAAAAKKQFPARAVPTTYVGGAAGRAAGKTRITPMQNVKATGTPKAPAWTAPAPAGRATPSRPKVEVRGAGGKASAATNYESQIGRMVDQAQAAGSGVATKGGGVVRRRAGGKVTSAVAGAPAPAAAAAAPAAAGKAAKRGGFLRRNWKPVALGTAGLGALGAVSAAPGAVRMLENATASPWAYGAGWSPTPYGYGHTPYGPGTPTMGAS
jgi:hypothetical protein